MDTQSLRWSFLGCPRPKWSLALGWGAVYALIPAWFLFANVMHNAPYAGWFGVIAGIVALIMSITHKSGLLMSFAILEVFSYIIVVIIAGVNTP